MSGDTTHARISKELYSDLKRFSFIKHANAKRVRIELDEAVKRYLSDAITQTDRRRKSK